MWILISWVWMVWLWIFLNSRLPLFLFPVCKNNMVDLFRDRSSVSDGHPDWQHLLKALMPRWLGERDPTLGLERLSKAQTASNSECSKCSSCFKLKMFKMLKLLQTPNSQTASNSKCSNCFKLRMLKMLKLLQTQNAQCLKLLQTQNAQNAQTASN